MHRQAKNRKTLTLPKSTTVLQLMKLLQLKTLVSARKATAESSLKKEKPHSKEKSRLIQVAA